MFCRKRQDQIDSLNQQLSYHKNVFDALSNTLAIIEFDPSGIILSANDNFLKVVGYQLNEIKGKNHRIFIDDRFAQTSEYLNFWSDLALGHHKQSQFKRITKSGEAVWIEATYTPVLDESGKVIKVIKVATDVTKRVLKSLDDRGQIEAINRNMAVIEFDLAGNIIHANNNFLKTMGYTLDEIKGKHHRMFVEPDYLNTPDYAQFWTRLARGDCFSGSFTRLGKNGKEVLIEASYNAILDDEGRPYKVVKYATDIGNNANMRLLSSAISFINDAMTSCAQGNLDSMGDIDHSPYRNSPFYPLVTNLNKTIGCTTDKLQAKVAQALLIAQEVDDCSESVAQNTFEVASRIHDQIQEIEKTSSSIRNISKTIEQTTHLTQQVNDLAYAVNQQASKGAQVMSDTINAMSSIESSSKKITDIVSIIDSIAFQTNLLALNAAVEAARAGEHGRGFAVVAGEVRALAGKSADAAKDIKALIGESVSSISSGTELAKRSGQQLIQITDSLTGVVDMIDQISTASKNQMDSVQTINKSLDQFDKKAQENKSLLDQSSNSADHLKKQAHKLMESMSYFRVSQRILIESKN